MDTEQEIDLGLRANGVAIFDLSNELYQFQQLRISVKLNRYKAKLKKPISLIYSGSGKLDLIDDNLQLMDFTIQLANLRSTGHLMIHHLRGDMTVIGDLNVPAFNLKQSLAALNIPYHPKSNNALKKASLKIRLKATQNATEIVQLQLAIDDSNLNGTLKYIMKDKPQYRFDLTLDQLNIDPYLPKTQKTQTASRATTTPSTNQPQPSVSEPPEVQPITTASANTQPLLPIKELRNLSWAGSFKAGSLTYHGLALTNVMLKTQNTNQQVTLAPLEAQIGKGSLSGRLTLNINDAIPTINANFNTQNVEVGPILQAFTGKNTLNGLLNFRAQLQTQGNSRYAWKNYLNGQGNLSISKGVINGIDLMHGITQGLSILTRGQHAQSSRKDQTPFGQLNASFTINKGILQNPDLVLTSNLFNVRGEGRINLINATLDYRLQAQYRPLPKWTIPLIVTGSLEKPTIRADVQRAGVDLLKSTIKKELEKNIGKKFDLRKFNLDKLFK